MSLITHTSTEGRVANVAGVPLSLVEMFYNCLPPPSLELLSFPPTEPGHREGEGTDAVKKCEAEDKQQTVCCYIITTAGIMHALIKIHVFGPVSHSRPSVRKKEVTCWFI